MKQSMSRVFTSAMLTVCLLLGYQLYAQDNFEGFIVCIDPGHQQRADDTQEPVGPGSTTTKPCVSSGTRGAVAGPEYAVVLDVGLRLHELLIKRGITVVMTHVLGDVDICNSERAAVGNRAKANLSIRLHCDAGSQHNCFTLYPALIPNWTNDIYDASLKAAQIVQAAYSAHVGIPSNGVIPRSDLSGFNWSDVPSILPEMLHMGNAADDQNIAKPEFRQKMAEGLAKGICEYLKTLPSPEQKTAATPKKEEPAAKK